jgi:hypothetical protein
MIRQRINWIPRENSPIDKRITQLGGADKFYYINTETYKKENKVRCLCELQDCYKTVHLFYHIELDQTYYIGNTCFTKRLNRHNQTILRKSQSREKWVCSWCKLGINKCICLKKAICRSCWHPVYIRKIYNPHDQVEACNYCSGITPIPDHTISYCQFCESMSGDQVHDVWTMVFTRWCTECRDDYVQGMQMHGSFNKAKRYYKLRQQSMKRTCRWIPKCPCCRSLDGKPLIGTGSEGGNGLLYCSKCQPVIEPILGHELPENKIVLNKRVYYLTY